MKKIFCLICIMAFLLCSCSQVSLDGYDNFKTDDSDYELNMYLLPSSDFTERFQYIDIDYHFREKYSSLASFYEATLVVVAYDEVIYNQAKHHCLDNMQLSKTNFIEYGNYTFFENEALFIGEYGQKPANIFPKWFNMFAYNDTLQHLVFMGFYSPDYVESDAPTLKDNWGSFLNMYFSDAYDWGQG